MSTLAARQSQKENIDVNNFWRWPTEYSKMSHQPEDIFVPETMKWINACADGGYVAYWPDNSHLTFTDHSVSAYRSGGWQGGVFLDLPQGEYQMEFCSYTQMTTIMFVTYVMQDDIHVKFGNSKIEHSFESIGHKSIEFEIKPMTMIALQLFGDWNASWSSGFVTISDIVIREA